MLSYGVLLELFVPFGTLLASSVLPLVLRKMAVHKGYTLYLTSAIDKTISVTAGMALAHWFLRMMPFTRAVSALINLSPYVPARHIECFMTYFGFMSFELLVYYFATFRNRAHSAFNVFFVPNNGASYISRPMANMEFMQLGYVSAGFAAMEGFNVGAFPNCKSGRYTSAIVHQMLLGVLLGVSSLRTNFSDPLLAVFACLYACSMPLGILWADIVKFWDAHIELATQRSWAMVLCCASGAFASTLFRYILLPEVTAKRKKRIYLMGAGVWLWVIVSWPFFDI